MDNMGIYNQARSVPSEAKKTIGAGRLKGMTDVNPMYRIKRLTEMFGPCGIGWWYIIKNKEIIDDEATHQRAAFVDIDLYYVDPESGETSKGIPGTGGASFVSQERNGPYLSDECFKMALTDAMSVSCKAIGIAADVYWDKDRTKYSGNADAQNGPSKPPVNRPRETPAQPAKPAQNADSDGFTPATEEQKQYIRDNASDQDYLDAMQEFGAYLENLSEADARRVIKEIDRNNADTTPKCVRCNKVITGVALPDGTTITASELIGKSKIAYGDVYCFDCMKALKKAKNKKAG